MSNNSLLIHKQLWEKPPLCEPPIFPIIYMEIINVKEAFGFLSLNHFIGDIDFSIYKDFEGHFIIDSYGKIYELGFIKSDYSGIRGMIYPKLLVKTVSLEELKNILSPIVKVIHDDELNKIIYDSTSKVEIVVELVNRLPN